MRFERVAVKSTLPQVAFSDELGRLDAMLGEEHPIVGLIRAGEARVLIDLENPPFAPGKS